MNVRNKILIWFDLLKTKPEMVIGKADVSYNSFKLYIEGYVDAFGQIINTNIRKDISSWFQKNINEQSVVYWTDHISFYFKDKSEDEVKEILLNITKEYFTLFFNAWYFHNTTSEIS